LGLQETARDRGTRAVRIQIEEAIVPALWWYELRNVVVLGERQGCLTERETARFLRDIPRLAIAIDSSPNEAQVLTLARRHRLTRLRRRLSRAGGP
jgi:hypothetical protein